MLVAELLVVPSQRPSLKSYAVERFVRAPFNSSNRATLIFTRLLNGQGWRVVFQSAEIVTVSFFLSVASPKIMSTSSPVSRIAGLRCRPLAQMGPRETSA
jgi:hypothetical protein